MQAVNRVPVEKTACLLLPIHNAASQSLARCARADTGHDAALDDLSCALVLADILAALRKLTLEPAILQDKVQKALHSCLHSKGPGLEKAEDGVS